MVGSKAVGLSDGSGECRQHQSQEIGSTAFLINLCLRLGQIQDTKSSQWLKIEFNVLEYSAGKIRCLWTPLTEQPRRYKSVSPMSG